MLRRVLCLSIISIVLFGLLVYPVSAHDAVEVVVSDQAISNGYVVIDHIYAYEAGWIAIHNGDDEAGNPVIGSVYIPPENSFHLLVPIDMSKATPELEAVVHLDLGEPGKFEFPGADMPDRKETGEPISAKFKVNGVSIKDQLITDTNTITVDTVIAQEDGFVAIHANTDSLPIIGSIPIKVGITSDVQITIDPAKATSEMTAAIHTAQGSEPGNSVGTESFWTADHLRVIDQLAGSDGSITIPSVLASKDGWLTIHSTAEGNPVIGVTPVKAGLTTNISLTIPTSTETVLAMLHGDEGERGKFEFPGVDVPLKDAKGDVIALSFLIGNGIKLRDQNTDRVMQSGSVMIDSVVAAQNGWLAVYSTGEGNPLVGAAFVRAGYNPQVQVMVSTDFVTENMLARLHIDAGQPGIYEFPDPDTPVMDNKGIIIAPSFSIAKDVSATSTDKTSGVSADQSSAVVPPHAPLPVAENVPIGIGLVIAFFAFVIVLSRQQSHTHDHHTHSHAEHDHHHDHDHQHDHAHGEHDHHDHQHDHKHGLWASIASALHLPGYGHSHGSLAEDTALYHNNLAIRTVWAALLILGLTTLLQVGVYIASESTALLGDTVHNLGDALNSIPLLLAFWLAKRKPTRRYTYGYGRVEDVAGLIIVASIAFSAIYILWESIQRLSHPHMHNLEWVIVASIIGFVGNEAVALLEIRVGRKIGSAAMITDGIHARTDGLTSLAVLVAAILTWLRIPIADPIIGIGIGIMIIFIARDAIIVTWYRLTDAIDPALVDKAEQVILSCAEVKAIHRLQLRWLGHQLNAEIVLAFEGNLTMEQIDALTDSIRHRLHHELPNLAQVTLAISR